MAAPLQPKITTVHQLRAVPLSPAAFAPFGQVIGACDDGAPYDAAGGRDATLDLSQGVPRLYVMRLPERGRKFHRITYHARVTQCLGCVQPGVPWYLAVAKPTGSRERFPRQNDLTAFRIPHGVIVRLHAGTWHAGPLFDGGLALGPPPEGPTEACARALEGAAAGASEGADEKTQQQQLYLDFFNLELSDTNVTDHNTHDYAAAGDGEGAENGVAFEVVEG
jgi:ureidoglycolate hydrolase